MPPYHAVVALVQWVERRHNWNFFRGWCVSQGIDLLGLSAREALDLIHFYIVQYVVEEKERVKINRQLSGPRLTDARRRQLIKAQAPDEPPMPWWWDEDDAAESSIMAARQIGLA